MRAGDAPGTAHHASWAEQPLSVQPLESLDLPMHPTTVILHILTFFKSHRSYHTNGRSRDVHYSSTGVNRRVPL
jgi:hypothetical protein